VDQQGNIIDSAITAFIGRMLTPDKFRVAIDQFVGAAVTWASAMDRAALANLLCNEVRAIVGVAGLASSDNEASGHRMLSAAPGTFAPGHAIYCGIVRRRLVRAAVQKGMSPGKAVAAVSEITDDQILSASEHCGVSRGAVVDSSIWDWIKANWSTIFQVVLSLLGLVLMFGDDGTGAPP